MATRSKIRVVDVMDLVDLRRVVSRRTFLREVATEHGLQTNQAVAYTNKAHTRWRLVLQMSSLLVMCQCEVEETNQFATYLRITEGLASMTSHEQLIEVNRLVDYTKERIRRNKKRQRKGS